MHQFSTPNGDRTVCPSCATKIMDSAREGWFPLSTEDESGPTAGICCECFTLTKAAALEDANSRLEEWDHPTVADLPAAIAALETLIGSDCECDNTHEANGTSCCLCQYRAAI